LTIFNALETISKNKLKYFKSFLSKKNRRREGKFLVEGEKCISEALALSFELTDILYSIGSGKRYAHLIDLAKKQQSAIYKGTQKNLNECSDTSTPQGIIALAREKYFDIESFFKKEINFLLLIDAVSDPGNLGTIIRTAHWFGIHGIFLGEGSCELYSPKVIRSTMGSIFYIPVVSHIDLQEVIIKLKTSGFSIYAADIHGDSRFEFKKGKIALILGNEASGISSEILKSSHHVIALPGKGKCESLNVAVSGGIILWEIFKNKNLNIRK